MLKKNKKTTDCNTNDTVSPSNSEMISQNDRQTYEKYEKIPLFFKIALGVAVASVLIYILSRISVGFSDFFNLHISSLFRFLFALVTNIFPFSVAEILIILLPILTGLLIWYLLKFRCKTAKAARTSVLCILSAATMIFSSFVLCFSTGYQTSSLDEKMGIESEAVYPQELYQAAQYLLNKSNELAADLEFDENGASIMPYDFWTMNAKLLDAYESFCQEYDFIHHFHSRLKPVMLSEPMSYTHITGVYTFFTGESNINVNFPDYTIPYTAAHEMAHQRGIAREDEANMMAFLVCIRSDDKYIQYSAYLNMYEYVASALNKADKTLYKEVRATMDPLVRSEQVAYNKFFKKYTQSVASKVSGAVNNAYLISQGTPGKKSYGMVVDLTVAYLKNENLIEN